jgi:hypothetical protein
MTVVASSPSLTLESTPSTPSRPNPRFRHGSRGVVRPPVTSDRAPETAAEAPPPAPTVPAAPTTGAARSLRPRGGSRGGSRQPSVETGPPSAPAAPAPRAEAPVYRPRPEPKPAAEQPAADEEVPSSGLLKRVTAALQRAVRGQEKPKDT